MEERLFKNYEWIVQKDAPWKSLGKDISEAKVALLTTGGLYQWKSAKHFNLADEAGDPSFREIKKSVLQEDVRVSHRYLDMQNGAGLDFNCLLPLDALTDLEREKRISAACETHFAVMGEVKDPTPILTESVPKIAKLLKKFLVDVVIVSAAGPWSHQTGAMIARELEEEEFSTVFVSSLRSVSVNVKPPRTILVRFPFGQPFGAPYDRQTQKDVLSECLVHVKSIREPGEIAEISLSWRDTFAKAMREHPELRSVAMGSPLKQAESGETE